MQIYCKNLVAAGLTKRVQTQRVYGIGLAHPLAPCINSFGKRERFDSGLEKCMLEYLDLRPDKMIQTSDLCRPMLSPCNTTATF